MKYHFTTFYKEKTENKGSRRTFEFNSLDEAVAAAHKLAPNRLQIVVLDEFAYPIYRTGKSWVEKGLKGEFYDKCVPISHYATNEPPLARHCERMR